MHSQMIHDQAQRVSKSGYPKLETLESTYNETDLDRAVQAYRFFYPTVSGMAIFKGNAKIGAVPNKVFGVLDTQPRHVGFTYNSDTPYGFITLDLTPGPMVVEVPAGPLIVIAMDVNQRWIADMGLPGPDAGTGGKHLLLPPDSGTEVPSGFHVGRSTANRALVGVRALPVRGDVKAALERIKTVKVRPLVPPADWSEPRWIDVTAKPHDTTPLAWEGNLDYWKVLHEVIDSEPAFEGYGAYYGELAALGIVKGKPFAPDARAKRLLQEAAQLGKTEMCAQSFADRRPDRVVWRDRKWEWAALRFENGDFTVDGRLDLEARDKWFYQAIGASPAMFRREAGSGSLYWLGTRDKTGAYLDGAKSYTLAVPQPVPCQQGSSPVGDRVRCSPKTRSQIQTKQGKACAALRSSSSRRRRARSRRLLALRADAAGRKRRRQGRALDPDHPRQGLVRVLSPLRPRAGRVRRFVEAGRLRARLTSRLSGSARARARSGRAPAGCGGINEQQAGLERRHPKTSKKRACSRAGRGGPLRRARSSTACVPRKPGASCSEAGMTKVDGHLARDADA